MIFKVFYQENSEEMPLRENTKVLYLEAENEREVRYLLRNRPINIEYIQELKGAHLEYEKQSSQFKLQEFNES